MIASLASDLKQLAKLFRLPLADLNLTPLAVIHNYKVGALQKGRDLLHFSQIDDRGAVSAKERRIGQTRGEIIDLVISPVTLCFGLRAEQAIFDAKEEDLLQPQEHESVMFARHDLAQGRRRELNKFTDPLALIARARCAERQLCGALKSLAELLAI